MSLLIAKSILGVRANCILIALVFFASFTSAVANDANSELAKAVSKYNSGNYAEALDIWEELAKDNNSRAQFNLGLALMEGKGTDRNYAVLRCGRLSRFF